MKILVNKTELQVIHALKMPSGHGHYKITVTIWDPETKETKEFYSITSNMQAIDKASELEGTEKIECLYHCIEASIQENIQDWISPIIS